MSENDGRFVWRELRVVDLDAAIRFYGELFGWTATENPMGRTLLADGKPIGGMSAVKPGLPAHWTPMVSVDDVDKAAAAAVEVGGIVTSGRPADVPGQGRIAPILDPQRNIVAIVSGGWPAAPADTGFVWDRLRTTDPAGAAAFYQAMIGWTPTLASDQRAGIFDRADGTRVAEFLAVQPGEPAGWLPFVNAADLAQARARAAELGAASVGEETDIPGVGRFAVVADPEGAELAIISTV